MEQQSAQSKVLAFPGVCFLEPLSSMFGEESLYSHTGMAGGDACRGGKNYFVDNDACLTGMFLKIVAECFSDGGIHRVRHFGVIEPGLLF